MLKSFKLQSNTQCCTYLPPICICDPFFTCNIIWQHFNVRKVFGKNQQDVLHQLWTYLHDNVMQRMCQDRILSYTLFQKSGYKGLYFWYESFSPTVKCHKQKKKCTKTQSHNPLQLLLERGLLLTLCNICTELVGLYRKPGIWFAILMWSQYP